MSGSEKNRDVFLNFGLIAYGPLCEIEKLQGILDKECAGLKLVYQTVSAKRLFLAKRSEVRRDTGKDERKGEEAAGAGGEVR